MYLDCERFIKYFVMSMLVSGKKYTGLNDYHKT